MQLPGTIKFQNNPKKEGKVTGGTSSKVKINGKEAAVIGSQVSTCNDMGMQNNSTVIAMGASIPMPAIINPANTEEWERGQEEKEKKEPKFSEVKWASTGCEEGEEVELTANVQDIADGNMVTLQVFPEGKGPEDSIPLIRFPLTVKGGSVSAKWSYRGNQNEMPPESNPRFVFSAHCAWCNFEKSSNSLEVKLRRPEITSVEWRDENGESISKGKLDGKVYLHIETKDIEDGEVANLEIFSDTQDIDSDTPLFIIPAKIQNNKFSDSFDFNILIDPPKIDEAMYQYYKDQEIPVSREEMQFRLEDYDSDVNSQFSDYPKYRIVAKLNRCKNQRSGELRLLNDVTINLLDQFGKGEKNIEIKLKDGSGKEYSKKTDEDGTVVFEDVVPGTYFYKVISGAK